MIKEDRAKRLMKLASVTRANLEAAQKMSNGSPAHQEIAEARCISIVSEAAVAAFDILMDGAP